LNELTGPHLDLYSVSKIQLYEYAYEQGQIPRYGIIYIGQKRNIWLWDFKHKKKVDQYNFDQLEKLIQEGSIKKEDIFLDTVYDYAYYPDFLRGALFLHYSVPQQLIKEYIEAKQPNPTKQIEANYMIDPNIGCG
jgi:hypothetical protein